MIFNISFIVRTKSNNKKIILYTILTAFNKAKATLQQSRDQTKGITFPGNIWDRGGNFMTLPWWRGEYEIWLPLI